MSTRCLRSGGVGFPSSLTWKTSSQHGKSLCLVSGEEDIWGIHVSTSPLTHTHTYIHTRTCKYNTHAHYTHIALESLLIHLGKKLLKLSFAEILLWFQFIEGVCRWSGGAYFWIWQYYGISNKGSHTSAPSLVPVTHIPTKVGQPCEFSAVTDENSQGEHVTSSSIITGVARRSVL